MVVKKQPPVIRKKVKPYPFEALLEMGATKTSILVKMLTLKGFVADVGHTVFLVGAEFQVSFELPAMKAGVMTRVKVMRTYDQMRDFNQKGLGTVERMAEFHFISIDERHKNYISQFLTAIRQV